MTGLLHIKIITFLQFVPKEVVKAEGLKALSSGEVVKINTSEAELCRKALKGLAG